VRPEGIIAARNGHRKSTNGEGNEDYQRSLALIFGKLVDHVNPSHTMNASVLNRIFVLDNPAPLHALSNRTALRVTRNSAGITPMKKRRCRGEAIEHDPFFRTKVFAPFWADPGRTMYLRRSQHQ